MSAYRTANATVSAHGAEIVTPSNSTTLAITRALFIGTSGDVAVTMADGQTVTFVSVASGAVLPVQVEKVLATGTTASDILALY